MESTYSPEEVNSVFDALIYTFDDFATSRLLAESLKILGLDYHPLASRLDIIENVRGGKFDSVRTIFKGQVEQKVLSELEDILTIQEVRWALHYGNDVSRIIDKLGNDNLSLSMTIGELLLNPETISDAQLHYDMFQQIYRVLHGKNRLQHLLNSALQFKDLLKLGKKKSLYRADLRSYVYTAAYLHFITYCDLIEPVDMLRILSANVRNVNQFGQQTISARLVQLLDTCMTDNPTLTMEILSLHPAFTSSVRHCTNWTPLGLTPCHKPAHFDYLSEYAKHARETSQGRVSIPELGRLCAIALRRHGADIFSPDSKTEISFPVHLEAILKSDVWSVCSDCLGRYGLFGTAKGQLYLHKFEDSTYTQLTNFESPNVRFDHPPGTERIKAHPTKPGIFAIAGGGGLTIIDVNDPSNKTVQYAVSSNSYGDICWHPEDDDLLFYCNDAVESINLLRASSKHMEKEYAFSNPFMAMCYCGDSYLALLSAKVHKKRQMIVLLNIKTNVRIKIRLPSVPFDGAYSTLVCSQWDQRTLMLIAQPNMIILVDRLGKRPARVIYGPKQENFMIKAIMFGPMDKYILVASEEKQQTPKAWLINRFTGDRIGYLVGHTSQVNDVSFVNNPKQPMLITGADDSRVLFYTMEPMS